MELWGTPILTAYPDIPVSLTSTSGHYYTSILSFYLDSYSNEYNYEVLCP